MIKQYYYLIINIYYILKEYINNLNVDYGTKLILYKNEYNGDDQYNYEIVNYLNNRDDLKYDDVKNILLELDFKVDEKGNISW